METATKIFSAILILFSLFMGFKHGIAMTLGKPGMLEMFGRWDIPKFAIQSLGIVGLAGTACLVFPRTFMWGNFITAGLILFIMIQFLTTRDMKGFLIELPFFLLPLLMIYLRHPLAKS